jgi:hypothetical protein
MYQPVPGAELLEVPADVQEMFDWAASRGVRWPKIVYPVRFPPGYIGSMATSEIHPNERIIIAPNRSLFTSKVARDSADLKQVFESLPESFSKSMLAYYGRRPKVQIQSGLHLSSTSPKTLQTCKTGVNLTYQNYKMRT